MNTIGLLATVAVFGAASASANAGAVITAKSSSLIPIDADEARRVFLGVQRNVDGKPVSVIYQAYGPTRTDFETKVLGKTGSELTTYTTMLIFTGRALPPKEAAGDDSIKKNVNATPGAVGYVSDDAIDDTVKVLLRY